MNILLFNFKFNLDSIRMNMRRCTKILLIKMVQLLYEGNALYFANVHNFTPYHLIIYLRSLLFTDDGDDENNDNKETFLYCCIFLKNKKMIECLFCLFYLRKQ